MSSHFSRQNRQPSQPFDGFEPLTANYVYCPNQFFDVCLPHCSRGAVRIVAHLLRQTLGWLDKEGNPLRQEIPVTYRDLIERAGVSRGAIGPALQEVIDKGFVVCQQQGRAKSAGQAGQSAVYKLRWDTVGEYATQLSEFSGFYAGEGNRTPVPNRFFDEVIRLESLSVVKVVGTVIRNTIGYQNQFGGRRSSAPLSYQRIQNYCNLKDRSTLSHALKHAQETGYIACLESGVFSPDTGQQRPATYGIRWRQSQQNLNNGSKIRPIKDQFKKPTSISSESRPDKRFKNPTTIKRKLSKDKLKQQVVAADRDVMKLLLKQGIDERTATTLLQQHGRKVVERQIEWLDARNPKENRIGMLRKAIEQDWEKPRLIESREKADKNRQRDRQRDAQQQVEDTVIADKKKHRRQQQQKLLTEWKKASIEQRRRWIQEAVEHETSAMIAEIIRRDAVDCERPHRQVLERIEIKKQ